MKNPNKRLFWFLFFSVTVLDQLSKWCAEMYLSGRNITVNQWLSFQLSYNTGCAWGMFSNYTLTLGLLGLIFLIIVFLFRKTIGLYQSICLPLMLGGVLGNVIDRLCRGRVIDFISINLQIYQWPVFNVADVAVCISAIGLICFSSERKY